MTNQQWAPEALRVEAAYGDDGKFIGYRLLSSGANGGLLVWADQKAMPGFRIGDHFVPGYREVIDYKPVALVEAQQPAAHVQNPGEIAHVAGDVSKNGPESNIIARQTPQPKEVSQGAYETGWKDGYKHGAWSTQQPAPATQQAQEPALFVSAKQLADLADPSHATAGSYLPARKTSAGRFTVALYTAPQPSPTAQAADSQPAPVEVADAMADSQYLAGVSAGWNAANADDPNAALQKLQESRAGYLKPLRAARAQADSVTAPAGEANWAQLRSALAMLMLGWGRNPNQTMDACYRVLDSATEPGTALAILRTTPDWREFMPADRAKADSVLEDAALSSEQQRAIFEAYESAASESYFEVRPQIDCNDRRRVFKAGYERGWDAARKQGANHD